MQQPAVPVILATLLILQPLQILVQSVLTIVMFVPMRQLARHVLAIIIGTGLLVQVNIFEKTKF